MERNDGSGVKPEASEAGRDPPQINAAIINGIGDRIPG